MSQNSPKWPMIAAFFAAISASVCCAGPLVLLLLGISGSWIATLTSFEPYRPFFILLVSVFLLWSGWLLYRPIKNCKEGSVCSIPKYRFRYRIIFWVILAFAIMMITSVYWVPLIM